MKYTILFLTLVTLVLVSCKKHKHENSAPKPDYCGTYKGAMIQNGPGPISNIPLGEQEFVVTNSGDNKITLEFKLLQMTVDANMDGGNFIIIPVDLNYMGNTVTVSGDGSFNNGMMQVNWKQALTISGIDVETVSSGNLKKE